MRYKKLFIALGISMFASQSNATYPDLNSMLQNFAPVAPVQAPELNSLIIAVNGLAPYPDMQQAALLTLVPLADGSLRAAIDGPMRQMYSALGERLLIVNTKEDSGYAAGDIISEIEARIEEKPEEKEPNKVAVVTNPEDSLPDLAKAIRVNGVWGQLVGDHLTQHVREGMPGYRGDTLGGIIGRDIFLAPHTTVGVAGGYQHARVTQHDLSGSRFDVDRYQATVYGRYHYPNLPAYILGAATLAANRYDNSRYILVPPVSGTGYSIISNAEFTGWESDLYLEQGFIFKCGQFRAVPKLMLLFSHLDVDSYIEHDALALNLTVKYQDMDELMLGIGGKIDYRNRFEKAFVVPEFHAYYFYDFMNDSQISTAEFFSGGYAFLSQGPAPSPNTLEVGAALTVHSYRNTLVKVQYDYTARSDYHRNGAFVKVRYEWA